MWICGLNIPRETVNFLHAWCGKHTRQLHGIRVCVHQSLFDLKLWLLFNIWYHFTTHGRWNLCAPSTPSIVTLGDNLFMNWQMWLTLQGYIYNNFTKNNICNTLWICHNILSKDSCICKIQQISPLVPQGRIIGQLMHYNFTSNTLMRSNENNGKDRKKSSFLQIPTSKHCRIS